MSGPELLLTSAWTVALVSQRSPVKGTAGAGMRCVEGLEEAGDTGLIRGPSPQK